MNLKNKIKGMLFLMALLCLAKDAFSQKAVQIYKAAGTPANPKVNVSWNRYYDSKGLMVLCGKIAKAYPKLVKLSTIGKSFQGKNLMCLTVTDFSKGDADKKPGIYLQGNLHGNEIQGAEYLMYTAWYLTESFKDVEYVKRLLAEKVFYIVPTVNPDARDYWMHHATNEDSPRSGLMPFDADRDGKVYEDGLEDLNGDGEITKMRKKNPYGVWRKDSVTNVMYQIASIGEEVIVVDGKERAKKPSDQNYDLLDEGGIDNDGDGLLDENGLIPPSDQDKGFYDPNRDWRIQESRHRDSLPIGQGTPGTSFRLPETRSVRDFFISHPNIAAAESLHNFGGALFPGSYADSVGSRETRFLKARKFEIDREVYDIIGGAGEVALPKYNYESLNENDGVAISQERTWMYSARGVFNFIVELFYLDTGGETLLEARNNNHKFSQELLLGDVIVPWKPFRHPVYGDVEIGGYKKNGPGRMTPGFLIESDAHRNMAFSLYFASQTPQLKIEDLEKKEGPNGNLEVTFKIRNTGLIPTHSGPDLINKVKPDEVKVYSGNKLIKSFSYDNIEGHTAVSASFSISKDAPFTIEASSMKGGVDHYSSKEGKK